MSYTFKNIDLHDGRWTSVPGIEGPVRTGPRGKRFRHFIEERRHENFIPPHWPLGDLIEPNVQHASHTQPAPSSNAEPETTAAASQAQAPTQPPCTCGTSYDCPRRKEGQPDCRTLTVEHKKWKRKMGDDAYRRQISKAVSDDPPKVATAARVRKIITYLDAMDNLTDASTLTQSKNATEKVRDWILEMQCSDIKEQNLQPVIQRIKDFLPATANPATDDEGAWLQEELKVIMLKWRRGDLQVDPKRGLKVVETTINQKTTRKHYKLDKTWPYLSKTNDFEGNGLVNGQTWFSRHELMRDGAHAEPMAGISGNSKEGAYSIVMSHTQAPKQEGYANIDMGEIIEYMGTALKENTTEGQEANEETSTSTPTLTTTACTATMKKSLATGKPVRVIRKFQVNKNAKQGPLNGYRYDGLYKVVGETKMSEAKQEWRFKMVREPGQGPLRKWSPSK